MKLFCKGNEASQKKQRAVVVLEIHRKVTRRSSFCNAVGCKTQFYLKRLRRTIFKTSCDVVMTCQHGPGS